MRSEPIVGRGEALRASSPPIRFLPSAGVGSEALPVEGHRFATGSGLSDEVRAAVPEIAALVLDEARR